MILSLASWFLLVKPSGCGGVDARCDEPSAPGVALFYLSTYMIAFGNGGYQPSIATFGSDQFDEAHDGERGKMLRFFNWFYFFVSIGALLAVTVLVYVQDNVGRRWGYGICAAGILVGLAVFLLGTRRYRFKKLVGSPLTQVAAVTVAAWNKRALPVPSDPDMLYDVDDAAAAGADVKGKQKLPHSKECR